VFLFKIFGGRFGVFGSYDNSCSFPSQGISQNKFCTAVGKEKAFQKKKAACAVTMAQAAFLPSGDFSEVVDKSRL